MNNAQTKIPYPLRSCCVSLCLAGYLLGHPSSAHAGDDAEAAPSTPAIEATHLAIHPSVPSVWESFDEQALTSPGAEILSPAFLPDSSGGYCLHLQSGNTRVCLPPESSINPEAGSIEMRIRFDGPLEEFMKNVHCPLFRAAPGEKAYVNGIFLFHGWGRGLGFMVCDRDGRRFTLWHPESLHWKQGEWHHVAATWNIGSAGESRMALYVDYKLVAVRRNLNIQLDHDAWHELFAEMQNTGTAQPESKIGVVLGGWGAQSYQPYGIRMDDFRIYPRERNYLSLP